MLAGPLDVSVSNVQPHIDFYVHGAITATGQVLPDMIERGTGTLLFTTGPSSVLPLPDDGQRRHRLRRPAQLGAQPARHPGRQGVYAAHVSLSLDSTRPTRSRWRRTTGTSTPRGEGGEHLLLRRGPARQAPQRRHLGTRRRAQPAPGGRRSAVPGSSARSVLAAVALETPALAAGLSGVVGGAGGSPRPPAGGACPGRAGPCRPWRASPGLAGAGWLAGPLGPAGPAVDSPGRRDLSDRECWLPCLDHSDGAAASPVASRRVAVAGRAASVLAAALVACPCCPAGRGRTAWPGRSAGPSPAWPAWPRLPLGLRPPPSPRFGLAAASCLAASASRRLARFLALAGLAAWLLRLRLAGAARADLGEFQRAGRPAPPGRPRGRRGRRAACCRTSRRPRGRRRPSAARPRCGTATSTGPRCRPSGRRGPACRPSPRLNMRDRNTAQPIAIQPAL